MLDLSFINHEDGVKCNDKYNDRINIFVNNNERDDDDENNDNDKKRQ